MSWIGVRSCLFLIKVRFIQLGTLIFMLLPSWWRLRSTRHGELFKSKVNDECLFHQLKESVSWSSLVKAWRLLKQSITENKIKAVDSKSNSNRISWSWAKIYVSLTQESRRKRFWPSWARASYWWVNVQSISRLPARSVRLSLARPTYWY